LRVTLIESARACWSLPTPTDGPKALCYHLRDRRVTLRLNEEVGKRRRNSGPLVVANLKSKKKVSGEALLLFCVGRQGNVDELNLPRRRPAKPTRAETYHVDEITAPASSTIFAVGDVIGFPSLGSVSMEQGRDRAARAFRHTTNSNRANLSYGIYTIPEISFIGKTEES